MIYEASLKLWEQLPEELDFVWWSSVLDEIKTRDEAYARHDGEELRRAADAAREAYRGVARALREEFAPGARESDACGIDDYRLHLASFLGARLDPREQQADLAASQAGVEAAQAQLDQANSEFARQDALYRQGLTTRSVFEQAQEAVRTAQASLDAAQAQQATSADALSYTQLRATAPGVVTARDIEVGQVVQAAETAFSVAEDGPRDAVFHVYERILFERPQTDHIALSLATDPSVSTTGSIREISPAVDTTTGTVRVKVGIYDVPDRMNLGSAVVGQALLPGTRGVIVPWSALASDAGQPAVWVVDIDTGTTDLRPVRIQAYETGRIILAGGVDAGEAVVVDGTKYLRPGEKVSVIEEAGS